MSKVIQYAHGELERNLAWVLAGEAEERADYVATMSNPLHRFATQGLLAVAKAMPNGVARALDREVGDSGLLYLGAGSKNTVLLDAGNEEVVKIHRASAFMSEEQRQKLAEVTNVRHRKLRNYLGDMAVEHGDFEVAPHPLARRSETRVVIGRQKVLSFIPLDVFSGYGPDVDPQAYSRLVKDFPKTASSLAILATYGLELIEDEGLVPMSLACTM
jgi:hypothetical protein